MFSRDLLELIRNMNVDGAGCSLNRYTICNQKNEDEFNYKVMRDCRKLLNHSEGLDVLVRIRSLKTI